MAASANVETTTTRTLSLWRHSNFLKLWASETISQFGTQFSGLAIPLTAVLLLKADSTQMGILAAVATVPFLVFGLLIGVWVDRHKRRRIMVTANLFRGVLLGLIPLAALTSTLTVLGLPLLYGVSFLIGVLTVFFDVSYQAYLPSLVEREQLVEGNSKLEASRSTAQVVGPSIAGLAIQLITAPIAIAVDTCSYFASAFSLSRISHDEQVLDPPSRPSVMSDMREGLGVVLKGIRLRSIAGSTGTSNLFSSAMFAIIILYFATVLGLTAFAIGVIFSIGSLGALAGVLFASKIAKRIGVGPAIVGSMFVSGPGLIAFYFASPEWSFPVLNIGKFPVTLSMILLMAGSFVISFATVVYNINQVSLRQAIVPLRLQGRMNASMRFLVWGTIPLGSLAGGILGTVLGLRAAIGIGALGGSLAFLWVLLSPVRSLRTIPESLE